MEVCGKPVRIVGKITSGHFTYCVLGIGHLGLCTDKDILGDDAETSGSTEEGWLLSGVEPDDEDEQASDPFLPTYVPEIPDGVVIQ